MENNRVKAKAINLRVSPFKARLVVDMVRGMNAKQAISTLRYVNKKAAPLVLKVIQSALANASHNNSADESKMFISSIVVGEAPTYKRIRPRAKGQADRVLKRGSHIMVTLEERA